MNDLLPIGSVIKIKNKKVKYIIIGRKIRFRDVIYDYGCVIYPYGMLIDKKSIYYFNDNAVEYVAFIGNNNY